jgi:DNA-binding transcriptional ArsR family regulator
MGRAVGRPRSFMPPSSSELISAVGHPVRRRILRAYLGGSIECASVSEIADLVDKPAAQVAYHLGTLAKYELLRLVQDEDGERPAEHLYGWALDVESDWLRLVLEVWAESDLSR